MKKKVFSILIGFVIGGLTFGTIGFVIAINYKASDITYNPKHSEWNVTTVEDAINYLYDKNSISFNDFTFEPIYSYTNSLNSYKITNVANYKYYYIIVGTWDSGSSDANSLLNMLKIKNASNATVKELGSEKGIYGGSESAASISYIIYPDGSGEDINITFNGGSWGIGIYGIK